MILKKIEIQGFKSFADRTEIVFSPGVIAVVGPNGSGKSNISDAVLWVLGEQNVRALRGQKYQDVIFAGTDKRRPIGMAEVSLTVDNSSGKLPIEFSEVTVTRRAYRSGESEFLINKAPCRLKDIYELFLDTGVGHEAYSMVSQGEVDAVLSARPEDRRALFDEAAGIKKYRHRKKEAERKLETTEQNLQRVNDIVSEIQSEIQPMGEQAEVAKRYLELASRLREIEVGILVNDLKRFTAEIQMVCAEKEADLKAVSDADALLAALEEEKSALSVDLANADAQVERYQAMHQEALTHAERTESQLALTDQKHQAAEQAEARLTEEIAQLEARVSQIEVHRSGISTEHEDADKEEAQLWERLAVKTRELQALEEKISLAARDADDHKANYIELAKQLAAQRNELANLAGRIESLQALLKRRSSELSDAERVASRSDGERRNAEKELEQVEARLASMGETMSQVRARFDEKRVAAQKAADELADLGRMLVDKRSRLKALREMEEAREGYFLGVRSVMAAVKSRELSGSFAVVADVIKVPRGYETAYEVALGSSLQDIIADSDREAKAAIEFLKKKRAGRATFLPLNMMRHTVSPLLRELVGKNGVLGLGNELIKFDRKFAPAIDALLAKVLVVQDVDAAIAVSKSAIGWSKIVTLDGELVFPSGAVTGGHAPGKTVDILGRKQEIDSLESDIRDLEGRISSVEKTNALLQKEADDLSASLASLEEEDTKCKMSLLEKERQLEFASREARRLAQELEALQAEKADVQDSISRARESQAALTLAIESADRESAGLDDLIAQTECQVRELQEQYDSVSAEIAAVNVSLASLTQKKLGTQQALQSSEAAARELSAETRRKHDQLESALREKADTEHQKIELAAELERARRTCDETHAQAEQWRRTKQAVLASSMEVGDRTKEVGHNRERITQKIHAAELREARLEMQIGQSTARLLDEYDVTAEEALRREPPEVKHGSAAEVLRLRREIKSMGEVNTGAVQEYARLTERFEFLNSQRQDLLDARQKLADAIREIDESTRGIFVETFEAVGAAFQDMFVRLFDGGEAELVLTDPDDILETGIDVMVEPPGKKRQNLLLLSGGERALIAAALIFALMFVRPSPFCILDEVDAPLDEANVEKFVDLLKDFAERSQMIVITHNKATMEAADILYGVTMQEPGVSKLVSVRLSEVAERN
ncbi:MAG TPA: chromosome segregation protein SMC [Armatimonadota bacterium]|nr:chromosome segregation protein SMC [Armatimonadota bacterium]